MIEICSSLQVSGCPHHNQNPRKTLKRLLRKFMFVENPSPARMHPSLTIPRRIGRHVAVQIPGTTMCPWNWAQDDNPDRVPRFLTKAVCPDCKHYCRAVLYYHKGLVQRCDVRIGKTVWKWTLVELPVAFVFDP